MKIDAVNYPGASQQQRSTATENNSGGASFASTLAAVNATSAGTASAKDADFTRMTRQELRGWVNDRIRAGEMSLDDSRPFMAMTMKIPVSGGGPELASGDGERFDVMQKARAGIEGALSRNDEVTLKMLKSVMSIMQQHQERSAGIDIRA